MNSKKFFAYVKLVLVIIIWSGVYHVAKYLVGDTDAFTLGFIRFFMATIVLLIMYFAKKGVKEAFTRPDNHWIMLWLIGLIGVFGYNVFFFGAESIIAANDVAIFFAFTPCITIILGRFILKQGIKPLAYVGIVVALLGTIGVVTMANKAPEYSCKVADGGIPWGPILAILSAFAMASYNVLNKKASKMGLDALTITTFSALMGTLFLFVSFLIFGKHFSSILHKPLMFWLAMGYVAIIATVVAYKWYSDAICELGVGRTAVFQNGIPFCTVLIGVTFLGNSISPNVILSGIVIIIGVIMTNLTIPKN